MGLFGSKSSRREADQEAPKKDPPAITVRQSDLERASKLLFHFLTVVGTTDHAVRSAVREIAIAGGSEFDPFSKEGYAYFTETGETLSLRPWRWLLTVGGHGYKQGNDELVSRLGLFTYTWMTQIKPGCLIADYADMRLDPPKEDNLVAIYKLSFKTLRRMDPKAVIIDHPTATITVQMLRQLTAEQLLQFEGQLDADIAQEVKRLVKEMHDFIDKNDPIL